VIAYTTPLVLPLFYLIFQLLKDNLIPEKIYAKGACKATFILMVAVLCLAAQNIYNTLRFV
jgi:hypothetical protein